MRWRLTTSASTGRFVPENGLHHLIAAYARVSPSLPFVVVGDAPYSEDYKRLLRKIAPPSVIFTGYQFGAAYHELSANAFAYLFGAEVGGTHPVLVEQLAHGNCVIARWTESNAEVAADAAIMFRDPETELAGAIESVLRDPELVNRMRERARNRAQAYSWDRITDEYERLLSGLTGLRIESPKVAPRIEAKEKLLPASVDDEATVARQEGL
jgi:glycosyltransferase involved in cell wall biosynthesis